MKWTALIIVLCTSCVRPEVTLDDGTKLTCGPSDEHNVATCTGGGRAYKCVTGYSGCTIDGPNSCGLVAQ